MRQFHGAATASRRSFRPTTAACSGSRRGAALLQSQLAEARVTVGAGAERPVVFPLAFLDRQVVDAGDAQPHQAVRVEFPVLVAVAAKPVAAVVVTFIGEADGNPVVAEGPDFLDEPVV